MSSANAMHDAAGLVKTRNHAHVTPNDVHKHAESNVWLRSIEHADEGCLVASFSIPRSRPKPRLVEFMEVQRQAGLMHAHRAVGLPYDQVLMINEIELRRAPAGSGSPLEQNEGLVHVSSAATRDQRQIDHRFILDTAHGPIAHGRSIATHVPPSVYRRIRSAKATSAGSLLKPRWLPDSRVEQVGIGVEPNDVLLSDHGSDHLSAMAILAATEAQLEQTPGRALASLSASFCAFVEHAEEATLAYQAQGEGVVVGVVVQAGTVKASIRAQMIRRDSAEANPR